MTGATVDRGIVRRSFPGPERLSSGRFWPGQGWSFLLLGRRLLGRRSLGHSACHLLCDGRFGLSSWGGFLDRRGLSGWRYLLGNRFVMRGWGFLCWSCWSFNRRSFSGGGLRLFPGWRLALSGRGPLRSPTENNLFVYFFSFTRNKRQK